MKTLIEAVHALSPNIRCVAVYSDGVLVSSEKAGLEATPSPTSTRNSSSIQRSSRS